MKTPFSEEQFFGVFQAYNTSVFPAQIVLLSLGLWVLFLLHSRNPRRSKRIGGVLGGLWLWAGIVYHLFFFTAINKPAYVFGALFILQGSFFLYETFYRQRLSIDFRREWRDYAGYFLILFGLVIYPLIGYGLEADWERTISLGLPCPTTIWTFGLLMLTEKRFPRYLLVIPSLWAVIGTMAAVNWGVYQDLLMIVAATGANVWLWPRKKNR